MNTPRSGHTKPKTGAKRPAPVGVPPTGLNGRPAHAAPNGAAAAPHMFGPEGVGRLPYGWGEAQVKIDRQAKRALANCFKVHDLLVPVGANPEDQRLGDASVLVTTGSTQGAVVEASLEWMGENWQSKGPFCVMWYTPGTRVATELRKFKSQHHEYRSAADLFLFPGQVDQDVESVLGEVPVRFAETQFQNTRFTYAILSVHRFDMTTGQTYFHFSNEIGLQWACAKLFAAHKFLFLTPKKLDSMEGQAGYTLHDLLITSQAVTIYTVAADEHRRHQDVRRIEKQFKSLCKRVLTNERPPVAKGVTAGGRGQIDVRPEEKKRLRLCITNLAGEPVYDRHVYGYLRPQTPAA